MDRHDADTLFIARALNATAIRGIMDDVRWAHIVAVIMRLMQAAQSRESQARRNPTFDGMIEARHHGAQVLALENLLRTLTVLYDQAGKVLLEAREKLPYAPMPQGDRRATETPAQGTLSP